jgi:hypothetical protein
LGLPVIGEPWLRLPHSSGQDPAESEERADRSRRHPLFEGFDLELHGFDFLTGLLEKLFLLLLGQLDSDGLLRALLIHFHPPVENPLVGRRRPEVKRGFTAARN